MSQLRVVVIGASAGGVEALTRVVTSLPPDLDAAVLVVMHLAATARSVLPQILSRAQTLGATYPINGQRLQSGRIYVAPPDFHLMVGENDRLILMKGPRENGCRPAVDPLFRSAALHYRERAIGIVLSGTLDDGSAGLAAIKAAGGTAIVQTPEDSLFAGMPNNAIDSVDVDFICPAAEIGSVVARILDEGRKPLDARHGESKSLNNRIAVETAIDGFRGEPHSTKSLGHAAEFACPECGGTLWEITEGPTFRFRCRVGHAYSAQHLLDEQTVSYDRAMWTALRALRERADLSARLARRFRESNHHLTADRYEREMTIFTDEANLLMQMMRTAQANSAIDQEEAVEEENTFSEELKTDQQFAPTPPNGESEEVRKAADKGKL